MPFLRAQPHASPYSTRKEFLYELRWFLTAYCNHSSKTQRSSYFKVAAKCEKILFVRSEALKTNSNLINVFTTGFIRIFSIVEPYSSVWPFSQRHVWLPKNVLINFVVRTGVSFSEVGASLNFMMLSLKFKLGSIVPSKLTPRRRDIALVGFLMAEVRLRLILLTAIISQKIENFLKVVKIWCANESCGG